MRGGRRASGTAKKDRVHCQGRQTQVQSGAPSLDAWRVTGLKSPFVKGGYRGISECRPQSSDLLSFRPLSSIFYRPPPSVLCPLSSVLWVYAVLRFSLPLSPFLRIILAFRPSGPNSTSRLRPVKNLILTTGHRGIERRL